MILSIAANIKRIFMSRSTGRKRFWFQHARKENGGSTKLPTTSR